MDYLGGGGGSFGSNNILRNFPRYVIEFDHK